MEIYMKDNIIEFPPVIDDLVSYKINSALNLLCESDDEQYCIDQILMALHIFLSDCVETELILYDIEKLRSAVELYYEQY